MKTTLRAVLGAVAAAGLLLPATTAVAVDAASSVTTTAARTGPPASVAVLGDSISAGTGADGRSFGDSLIPLPGSERPNRSWATGDQYTDLQSVFQRVRSLRPGQSTTRANLAVNGSRGSDVAQQVRGAPVDVGLILVQIGGNDLCRPTVQDMTPVEEYRAQIDATLAWIAEHRPEALVQVNSVPDIYRLWELRRTNAVAVTFWSLGLIPCQSLLANPTSQDAADVARRDAVRAHGLAYNDQLREACARYLRCRYDDDATWRFSNDPATFVDSDVSSQDHFHPSYRGQVKLAEVSWLAGFDFADEAVPQVTLATTTAPTSAGWHAAAVDVEVVATDEAGVAGIESRVHAPDGSVGTWQTSFGDRALVTVEQDGASFVEARAIDVNGNVSASEVHAVSLDRQAPTVTVTGVDDGDEVLLGAEAGFGVACDDDRSGVASCEPSQADGVLDTTTAGRRTLTVTAVDAAGNRTEATVGYRVVYDVAVASDRLEGTGPIEIQRNAMLPVRVSVRDAAGQPVAGVPASLRLVSAHGTALVAGELTEGYDGDRYGAQLPLRRLGVTPGGWTLVADLDDGTTRVLAELDVR
ncbi:SGNH/GDSL hydrolase family protein [Egicoccus halophilus]|uniref:SGNH/GDSL hydrolase family protein n=1 Tax=Egicoccus halophilus TaxID=1670830 RepID=UPI0013EEC39E|nr:SGNH/GDSL hydrolase family protein [Egicoccus halophilus]